jgi:hypothetical protein
MFFEILYIEHRKSTAMPPKLEKTSPKKGCFCSDLNIKSLIASWLKGGTVRDHIQHRVGLRLVLNGKLLTVIITSETISSTE